MASAYVIDELRKHPEVQVEEVNPAEFNLPFPGTDPNSPATRKLQKMVSEATGVVLATPEYHGSFSSVMKLVIENLGFPSVLAGKPVALWAWRRESIGAIKSLEHLRGVVSHVGGIALAPAHLDRPRAEGVRLAGTRAGPGRREGGAPGGGQSTGLYRE